MKETKASIRKKKRERKVDWLTDRQINMLIEIKKSSGKSERERREKEKGK